MTRIILTVCASLMVTGCAGTTPPANQSICEALRPDMPVTYHGLADTQDTIAKVRRINARYKAACGG